MFKDDRRVYEMIVKGLKERKSERGRNYELYCGKGKVGVGRI